MEQADHNLDAPTVAQRSTISEIEMHNPLFVRRAINSH